MASDYEDCRRKHRCTSSDDEDDSIEDSKRHKHRHHHRQKHRHHHRHHHRHKHQHRHSSKKRDEERNDEVEIERKEEVEKVRGIRTSGADYDMEEGEIVEDDEGIAEVANKKVDSDVESGEFKADSYTRVDIAMARPTDSRGKSSKNSKPTGSDRSDGSMKHGSHCYHDELSLSENIVNGDSHDRSRKNDSRSHRRIKSPLKKTSKEKDLCESGSRQQSVDSMEVDEDGYIDRRNLLSLQVRENRQKASSHSPSLSRCHMEISDRSRSVSPDRTRERECSQSISKMLHGHERDDMLYDNGKVHYELEDERDSHRSTEYRLDGRDIFKDKERERSSSYHKSSMRKSKDEGGESWDRDREEKLHRDMRRVKEQEISRERYERDDDRDRDSDKTRERSRGRDRERERVPDNERSKPRETRSDIDWDRERDRERRRDKDRGWSKDRDLDREQRRDNNRTSYRDRDAEIERDTKLRDRDRKLEMDRERDRNIARDRYRDKTRDVESDRNRRYHKYDDRDDGYGNRDRRHGYEETEYRRDRDRDGKHASEKDRFSKDDSLKQKEDRVNRDDDDQKEYEERVDLELAEQEEDDPDRIKEKSRRLREAILQKYKAQQSQHEAPPQSAKALNEEPEEQPSQNLVATNVVQEKVDVKSNGQTTSTIETPFNFGKQNETKADKKSTGAAGLGEGTPKSERSNDMFSDDIFGDSPAEVRKMGKGDGLPVERSGLHDNWDDPEGYYSFRFGEILDGRYEITAAHGKGVFSTVVRAKDLKAGVGDPEEVAIKIIRNNETMLKAGTEELVILKKLVGADPEDRRHCVRYLSHFKYRNHLCIVFESLHMNLREVLKKFGRNIGLKLTAVRAYAKQLFIALKHLKNCGVLHCDIKPDNMLVNDAKNVLKLCDFGNAMFAGKNEITPYLVSRFYRAPEIILGLPYDHPMDIWSVGCCLYELYTGKVLFPGATNNDMLRLHMELKGSFPKKMLRKGAFIEQHFDQDLNFLAVEEDPVTKKIIRRQMVNIKPKDIGAIIKGSPGEDPKMLANFKDLLDKIFVLDPDKRLTVSQALSHPFITGK